MRIVLWALVAWIGAASTAAVAQSPASSDRSSVGSRPAPPNSESAVESTLSALHAAASRADGAAYFELFTPDAVFIGTDVAERWMLAQFRAYAAPIFAQGRGWTYTLRPGTRHIAVAPDGRTAWFDEVLDSASYGTSRGTGVLVLTPQGWRIAQYHLTFPIPNDLAGEITARIRAHEARTPPAP